MLMNNNKYKGALLHHQRDATILYLSKDIGALALCHQDQYPYMELQLPFPRSNLCFHSHWVLTRRTQPQDSSKSIDLWCLTFEHHGTHYGPMLLGLKNIGQLLILLRPKFIVFHKWITVNLNFPLIEAQLEIFKPVIPLLISKHSI